jgi:phage terminase Nu1 subunit (DNA packaging protein)
LPSPTPQIEPAEREILPAAIRKTRAGEKLTAAEKAALKRFRQISEEADRWRFYATIPKKHWVKLSGRQHKVLDDQAGRYGVPILGSQIDLAAVARWLHDFLARNARKLAPEEKLLEGDSDWAEKYRKERALLLRLERREREGHLVSRDKSDQCWSRVAGVIRRAGETLQRQFGAAALRILNRALVDATREVDAVFSDGSQPDPTDDGGGDTPLPGDGADTRDPDAATMV